MKTKTNSKHTCTYILSYLIKFSAFLKYHCQFYFAFLVQTYYSIIGSIIIILVLLLCTDLTIALLILYQYIIEIEYIIEIIISIYH